MVEKVELTQRLSGQKEALNIVITEFVEHVRTTHPNGIPATSCHPCGNYKWTIQMREFFVDQLENRIGAVRKF